MNRKVILPCILFAFTACAACQPADEETLPTPDSQQTVPPDEEDNQSNSTMENHTITLSVNGHSFTATLVDNSSTRALQTRLAQGNIHLQMNDYNDMEKVGHLGFSLPRNDTPITTVPGDIILYQGNSLAIYYDTNSWNFTRLGKINGASSREEILALLGGKGAVTVVLSQDH